jgi:hypothetical protein
MADMVFWRSRRREVVPSLWATFHEILGLNLAETNVLWKLVSEHSGADYKALAYTFVKLNEERGLDLYEKFLAEVPPKRYVELLEKLVLDDSSKRRLVTKTQDGILRCLDKKGRWGLWRVHAAGGMKHG